MMFMIVHAATPCFHVSKLVMCGKQMQFAFNCVQMSPVCFVSNRVSLKERSCHVLLVQFWGSSISVAFCRSIWKCHTWHDDPEDATHLNHILGSKLHDHLHITSYYIMLCIHLPCVYIYIHTPCGTYHPAFLFVGKQWNTQCGMVQPLQPCIKQLELLLHKVQHRLQVLGQTLVISWNEMGTEGIEEIPYALKDLKSIFTIL